MSRILRSEGRLNTGCCPASPTSELPCPRWCQHHLIRPAVRDQAVKDPGETAATRPGAGPEGTATGRLPLTIVPAPGTDVNVKLPPSASNLSSLFSLPAPFFCM